MVYLYFAGLIVALYYVVKILGPEMAKPLPPKVKPALKSTPRANVPENRVEKLEALLAEKNNNIGLLQNELKIFHSKIKGFDKIKLFLEEEIHRLREQNNILRSELGMPSLPALVETQENSTTSIASESN